MRRKDPTGNGYSAIRRFFAPTQHRSSASLGLYNDAMNPRLDLLQSYPFEKLRLLFAGIAPNPAKKPISLGIGEPQHATPEFIK
ncbi:MAG TPA: hypothetical protein VGM26_06490, partial [Rhizomicrobium sp.]